MVECVNMRDESSNSFTSLELLESEEPSSLRQEKSSPLISLDQR
jgi:hypothetical protein